MRIFEDLSEIEKDKNTILTLGTFDGIHLGHKALFKEVLRKTEEANGRSFVLTFYPHPKKVVTDGYEVKSLSTRKEKAEILEKLGIGNFFIIEFTKEFSRQTAEEFLIKYVIESIGLKEIIIGYDHHFGKGRGGDERTLREMGEEFNFNVTVIPQVEVNGDTVSSTKVRKALMEGNIEKAKDYLGRYYSFSGVVVEGDKRGRELGFPTANIKLDEEDKLLPKIGIYAVEFSVDGMTHKGLLSIGKRPTFYDAGKIVPEVYIYNFNEDIYGKFVSVKILKRIRGEEKFNSAEELIAQMNKDKQAGLEIFESLNM